MAYKPRKDIKVSESYIQKLRDAGSKKAALEKYGKSTDPKMREALRRFYGASAPAPMKDSSRTVARTLPKKSIPMKSVSQAKPKSSTAPKAPGRVGPGQVVQTRRSAAPTTKAPNRAAANKGVSMKQVGANVRKFDDVVEGAIVAAIPIGRAAQAGKALGKKVVKSAKSASIAKNTRTLKTATGSKKNLARTKVGYAKGLATKSEVKQAKAAVSKRRITGGR